MVALTSFFRFLLTRDLSSAPGEPGQNITVFSLLGGTSAAILFSTFLLGFSLLFAFLHVCLVRVPACRRLDGKTRAQASAWISASVHHAVVVAVALACIACDVSEGPPVDARTVATFVPLSLAYIASDFFATCVPELREGKWEMTLHHVMGFIISAATLIAPPFILRFAPYMWLCEASNLGLGVSWAAMKLWGRGGRVQKIAEGYFVVSFTFTRIVCLPLVIFNVTVLHWTPLARFVGVAVAGVSAVTLWLIVALQFFWFIKIIGMLIRDDKKGAKKEDVASPGGSDPGAPPTEAALGAGDGPRFRGANGATSS